MNSTIRKALFIFSLALFMCPLAQAGSSAIWQTNLTYDQLLENNKFVVVKLWMPNCGPCKTLAPRFEDAADKLSGQALFLNVNVHEYRAIASRYNVRSVPLILYIKNGQVISTHRGGNVSTAMIERAVNNLLG